MKRPGPNPDLELARRGKKARFLPYRLPTVITRSALSIRHVTDTSARWYAPFAFSFSRITLSVTPRGLAVLSLFLSRERALVRAFITREQPRRDKYR